MTRRRSAMAQDGFTFTEVLIVVVVIALMTAIFTPAYLRQRDRARDAVVRQGAQTIAMGVRMYALDHDGRYPLTVSDPQGSNPLVDGSHTPYLDAWPDNPWTSAPMANARRYRKGDFRYAGYSNIASAQPTDMQVDQFSLVGWTTNQSQPYVAAMPAPEAFLVNVVQ
jgi:prepilin-type N-terminal cleavage/methylation domain-containing protein